MKINNKYSEIFVFRIARIDDQENIMSFIRRYWKNDHILGIDKAFFKYEHGGSNNTLNFILGINRKTSEIQSVQGFIPYSSKTENLHICGVISLTHPNNTVPLLGLETMKRMLHILQPVTYCGIGTNPITMLPLVQKFLKRHVGIMSHYYKLNHNIKDFKVAVPDLSKNLKNFSQNNVSKTLEYEKIENFSDLKNELITINQNPNLPHKSCEYVERRYLKNPIFEYQIYKISGEYNVTKAIVFAREVFCNGRYILHWVDYIGETEFIKKLSSFFNELIKKNNYEYIDCLCNGIEDSIFKQIGFNKKDHEGKVIIPSYFEPFYQRNIKIHFEKSHIDQILFKGDADADRPNSIRAI